MGAALDVLRDSDLEAHTAKIRVIARALHDLFMDDVHHERGYDEDTGWLHQVFTEALERESEAINDIVFGPDPSPPENGGNVRALRRPEGA